MLKTPTKNRHTGTKGITQSQYQNTSSGTQQSADNIRKMSSGHKVNPWKQGERSPWQQQETMARRQVPARPPSLNGGIKKTAADRRRESNQGWAAHWQVKGTPNEFGIGQAPAGWTNPDIVAQPSNATQAHNWMADQYRPDGFRGPMNYRSQAPQEVRDVLDNPKYRKTDWNTMAKALMEAKQVGDARRKTMYVQPNDLNYVNYSPY